MQKGITTPAIVVTKDVTDDEVSLQIKALVISKTMKFTTK